MRYINRRVVFTLSIFALASSFDFANAADDRRFFGAVGEFLDDIVNKVYHKLNCGDKDANGEGGVSKEMSASCGVLAAVRNQLMVVIKHKNNAKENAQTIGGAIEAFYKLAEGQFDGKKEEIRLTLLASAPERVEQIETTISELAASEEDPEKCAKKMFAHLKKIWSVWKEQEKKAKNDGSEEIGKDQRLHFLIYESMLITEHLKAYNLVRQQKLAHEQQQKCNGVSCPISPVKGPPNANPFSTANQRRQRRQKRGLLCGCADIVGAFVLAVLMSIFGVIMFVGGAIGVLIYVCLEFIFIVVPSFLFTGFLYLISAIGLVAGIICCCPCLVFLQK